jgi:hypothetical protein
MTATLRGGRFAMSGALFVPVSQAFRSIIAHLMRKDFT